MKIVDIIHCLDEYVEKYKDKLALTSVDQATLTQLKANLRQLDENQACASQVVALIQTAAQTIANPIPHPILSNRLQSILDQF